MQTTFHWDNAPNLAISDLSPKELIIIEKVVIQTLNKLAERWNTARFLWSRLYHW